MHPESEMRHIAHKMAIIIHLLALCPWAFIPTDSAIGYVTCFGQWDYIKWDTRRNEECFLSGPASLVACEMQSPCEIFKTSIRNKRVHLRLNKTLGTQELITAA